MLAAQHYCPTHMLLWIHCYCLFLPKALTVSSGCSTIFIYLFLFLVIFPFGQDPSTHTLTHTHHHHPFLSFLEPSSTSSPPLRHYVLLTGQTCLPPLPPLPSPPFPPLVFFSGFFQASCHTTANSWNSCRPLASNRRLSGRRRSRGKQSKKREPDIVGVHFFQVLYCSTCLPVRLLTEFHQVSSYNCFIMCFSSCSDVDCVSDWELSICPILRMLNWYFPALSPRIIPTHCQR